LVAAILFVAAPASAQVVQSLHVGAGGFFPRGFDARVEGDVLIENLTTVEPLFFEIGDFNSGLVLGEWNVAFGDHIEVGAGIGYFRRTVPSVYRDLINDDGREIEQELRLRVVPVTGIVRFLPVGSPDEFQPYVGIGVSLLNWRYSEVGEFVDLSDFSVFTARFKASGAAPGAVVVYGARIPIDGDIYGLTLEGRYQWGEGDTGGFDAGFLGDKIDLGGGSFTVGFLVRF
jgi:hypothetical protein